MDGSQAPGSDASVFFWKVRNVDFETLTAGSSGRLAGGCTSQKPIVFPWSQDDQQGHAIAQAIYELRRAAI